MIIRPLFETDKDEVDRIYNKHFIHLEKPNFYNKDVFPCPFIVASSGNRVIVAGGVKTIAEVVVVSDRDFSIKHRLDALIQALGSTITIAKDMKYRQIHVFVSHDDSYVSVLQKFGFKLLDAKVLTLDIGESHG